MLFVYNNLIRTHLSSTLEGYNHLSPVYVITYAIVLWGKENGIDPIRAWEELPTNQMIAYCSLKRNSVRIRYLTFVLDEKFGTKRSIQNM